LRGQIRVRHDDPLARLRLSIGVDADSHNHRSAAQRVDPQHPAQEPILLRPRRVLTMAIDTTTPRTRRALLAGAVGGLAALTAHAFGQSAPVRATDPNDVVLGGVNVATSVTSIENTTYTNTGTEDGILGKTSGQGAAVRGVGVGFADGVVGHSDDGIGVTGEASNSEGIGVAGQGGRTGVSGGGAQWGVAGEAPINSYNAAGVYGHGHRGGRFFGSVAQIWLEPAIFSATHPASGKAGDFFVDTSHRLWFCKGGTTWKQLA